MNKTVTIYHRDGTKTELANTELHALSPELNGAVAVRFDRQEESSELLSSIPTALAWHWAQNQIRNLLQPEPIRPVWESSSDDRPRNHDVITDPESGLSVRMSQSTRDGYSYISVSPVFVNHPNHSPQVNTEPDGVRVPQDMMHFDRPSTTNNFAKMFWTDGDGKCRLSGTAMELKERIAYNAALVFRPRDVPLRTARPIE